jgi:hypothetical protein
MGDGDGAALGQQQLRHRLAHEDRAADDDGIQPRQIAQDRLEQHQAAQRGARDQPRQAGSQSPGTGWMEAIDILGGVDGLDDL